LHNTFKHGVTTWDKMPATHAVAHGNSTARHRARRNDHANGGALRRICHLDSLARG